MLAECPLQRSRQRRRFGRLGAKKRPTPWQSSGYNRPMRPMTIDLDRGEARPYFLWDEDLSIVELRERLAGSDQPERQRLLAKLLREARDIDVWAFVTPQEVADALPTIARRLGRRRSFWEFLIRGWQDDGVLST